MIRLDLHAFGRRVRFARTALGLTQDLFSKSVGLNRFTLSRLESGAVEPSLADALRIAEKLKVSLEWIVAGVLGPAEGGLETIAVELHRLGLRDLVVSDARVPGSLRHTEEVLVIAVSGDRPNPRVVEGIPFVLAQTKFLPSLIPAFAKLHDRRAWVRLAWLADVALALDGNNGFPPVATRKYLEILTGAARGRVWPTRPGVEPVEPDSLGHPDTSKGRPSPVWLRWKITYAGRVADFLHRTAELTQAARTTPIVPEGGK